MNKAKNPCLDEKMQLDILNLVLRLEGGYVNDKDDPGGETIFGITRKNWPNLKLWHQVDAFKKNGSLDKKVERDIFHSFLYEIEEVYKTYFIFNVNGKEIEDLSYFAQLFAFAVNAGKSRALSIASNCSTTRDLVHAIESYYRSIAKGAKAKFLKSWLNRLKHTNEFVAAVYRKELLDKNKNKK